MTVLLFSLPLNILSHLVSVGRSHDYKYSIPSVVNKQASHVNLEILRFRADK